MQHNYSGQSCGAYDLLRALDLSSLSSLYVAQRRTDQQTVLLHLLTIPEAKPQRFYKRMQAQLKPLSALKHPNISPVLDFGIFGEQAYIVMPYYAGGTLKQRLAEFSHLSQAASLKLLAQIAPALDYAYEQGYLQGSLRPEHIFFDGEDQAYLGGFGLRGLWEADALIGSIVTNPRYISPEQVKTEAISSKTDQYLLGLIAYECLTGHSPYTANSAPQLMLAHCQTQPRPITSLLAEIDQEADKVFGQALAKNPAQRHANNRAFVDKLKQSLNLPTSDESGPFRLEGEAEMNRFQQPLAEIQAAQNEPCALYSHKKAKRPKSLLGLLLFLGLLPPSG